MRASAQIGFAAILGGLVLLLAMPVQAQINSSGSRGFQPPTRQKLRPEDVPQTPPPALPGAISTATPAEKVFTDLPPTESLFDAINRGDIGAARDALSRGADMGGHNVLGMTPLELSVDLGRNDITFLLLSMRGSSMVQAPASAGGHRPATLAGVGKPPHPSALASAAASRHLSATIRAVRPAASDGLAPASVRYAGANPGTPNPEAGFLGFGP